MSLREILQIQKAIILDGALATELEAHGARLDGRLWSARILFEKPELILFQPLLVFGQGRFFLFAALSEVR